MGDDLQNAAEGVEEDFGNMLEQLKTRKKKNKPEQSKEKIVEASQGLGVMTKDQYMKLLSRVYDQLRANNPDLVDPKKALIRPPIVNRVGTSRIIWKNFAEICRTMRRDQNHVMNFFLTELSTTGSMTSQQEFLMKGKFVPKYIESLLKKYINEYVTCHMCRGVDTKLSRDTNARMNIMTCEKCGATRAVAPIQKGFQATSREERRAARNAA